MAIISPFKLNIAKKLEDRGYRSRFFRGQAQDEIAMRIRELREKREKTQLDLEKESKIKQSAISRIEQADYSGWTFKTLFRIADALDARLQVSFDPAEDVIDQYKEREKEIATMEDDSDQFVAVTHPGSAAEILSEKKDESLVNDDFDSPVGVVRPAALAIM